MLCLIAVLCNVRLKDASFLLPAIPPAFIPDLCAILLSEKKKKILENQNQIYPSGLLNV